MRISHGQCGGGSATHREQGVSGGQEQCVRRPASHRVLPRRARPILQRPTTCSAALWSQTGSTAVIVAASEGHDEVVQLLLKMGADANATNKMGATGLIVAAQQARLCRGHAVVDGAETFCACAVAGSQDRVHGILREALLAPTQG